MSYFTRSMAAAAITVLASTALASTDHGASTPNMAGRPGDANAVSRTIRVEASDFKYNVAEMSFKAGETVKFVLTNKGQQDHQLTIGDAAYQAEHQAMTEHMASDPDTDMSGAKHSMESSITAKPGETKELVWQFTKAGTFEFACGFPGHADLGMKGKIMVN